jgi:ABC-type transport system involved in multi-copper enzyme maturation permease subunit
MGKLFRFELLKNRKNIKNIATLCLFIMILVGYIILNGVLSEKYKIDERVNYTSDKWYSIMKMNELLGISEEKDMSSDMKTEIDFWRQVYQYSVSQDVYKNWRGEDKWRDVVRETIEKNEYLLKGKEEGITTYNRISDQELRNEIAKNKAFLEKDIKPLDSEYQMTSLHFLYRLLNQLFPYLIVIIVLIICADSMSSELDTGSYKFLMLQPYKRSRIFYCKSIATIGYAICSVVGIVALIFVINGCINGFGNPEYPVAIDGTSFGKLISDTYKTNTVEYIGIGKFLLCVIPISILYLLFSAVFALLISTLAANSIASLSMSVGLTLAAIMLQPYIENYKTLRLFYPVSYCNPIRVLSGGTCGTALMAILTLSCISIVVYIGNLMIFKKRDLI